MATTAPKKKLSTIKRDRQSLKRNLRNRMVISEVRTYIKKLNAAIQGKNKAEIETTLRDVVKMISSAASKGILHKNTASRSISRLSKRAGLALKAEAA